MEAIKENGFEGQGWYTIRFWDNDSQDWATPEKPEPMWIDFGDEFEEATSHYYDFYEPVVEYLGDGENPDE